VCRPEEFLWKLKGKPELETLRRWLAGKPRDLTLQALRIFARTERSKGTEDACRRFVHARNRYLKLAKESPTPPAEEPGRDLPNAISRGKLLVLCLSNRFTDVAPPFRAACRAKARRYEGVGSPRDCKGS
jgi:hypothetical protein